MMDEFREFHLEDERPIVVARHHVNSVKGGNRTVVRTTDGDWFQITESYAELRAWLLGGERKAAATPNEIEDGYGSHSPERCQHPAVAFHYGVRWAERHHGIGGGE